MRKFTENEKHGKQINLDAISKQEAPQLLKHFFLDIRQTAKENKGKEYEPGTLQTFLIFFKIFLKFISTLTDQKIYLQCKILTVQCYSTTSQTYRNGLRRYFVERPCSRQLRPRKIFSH